MSPRPRHTLPHSFRAAWRGLIEALGGQRNLRIHFVLAVAVMGCAAMLRLPIREWIMLLLAIGLVMTAELLNTAIETVVDLACPEQHELARRAKDISAAAVLFSAIIAAVIGILIMSPAIFTLIASR